MTDDDVKIPSHLRELDKIRTEQDARESNGNGRFTEDRTRGGGTIAGGGQGYPLGVTGEKQGTREADEPAKRLRKRVRQADGSGVNSAKSDGGINSRLEEPVKKRGPFNIPFLSGDDTPKPEPEPVAFVTDSEADENREHLLVVYMFLSSLPDDFLEMIVRDHEPVTIWQLSPEEADALVEIKLRQAKTQQAAAREVRRLLDLYDRIYSYTLLWPRLVASGRLIIEHKGLSWK